MLLVLAAGCARGDDDPAPSAANPTTVALEPDASPTEPATPTSADPSAGCSASTPVAPGAEQIHLESDGADRWYLRQVPSGYDGTSPAPLVVDLHGYSAGAELHTAITGLAAYGDRAGFITVTPNGHGTPVHWNAAIGSDDVDLIGTILDQVEAQLCVDTARVYVAGFSNGAAMTSVVACQHAHRIAAVAPIAGMRDVPGCEPVRPVPAITFHGTADEFVRYDGGMGAGLAGLPASDGSGRTLGQLGAQSEATAMVLPGSIDDRIPDIAAAWAERNGCDPTSTDRALTDDVSLVEFDCPDGAAVQLYLVIDGGHAWPGSATSAALSATTGPTTMDLDATALIWEFFAAHPLDEES
jgi:polyhydroxybutyrate depolymerase